MYPARIVCLTLFVDWLHDELWPLGWQLKSFCLKDMCPKFSELEKYQKTLFFLFLLYLLGLRFPCTAWSRVTIIEPALNPILNFLYEPQAFKTYLVQHSTFFLPLHSRPKLLSPSTQLGQIKLPTENIEHAGQRAHAGLQRKWRGSREDLGLGKEKVQKNSADTKGVELQKG